MNYVSEETKELLLRDIVVFIESLRKIVNKHSDIHLYKILEQKFNELCHKYGVSPNLFGVAISVDKDIVDIKFNLPSDWVTAHERMMLKRNL